LRTDDTSCLTEYLEEARAYFQHFFSHNSIKGFLAAHEGEALYRYSVLASSVGPCLEIGSYCGKSTVYMGHACQQHHNTLYAVDHHRGSEEHQLGEEYHDSDLYDSQQQLFDSFPLFRRTLRLAALDNTVVPVVASSAIAVRHWVTPLGMVFIDGGHSHEMARNDCLWWSEKVAVGGFLAIHDIFECPEDGGQGPYLAMCAVLEGGMFERVDRVDSLVILKRTQ